MKQPSSKNYSEPVTMKTIAEEAGVTLTTVSRILNNKGGKYADKTKKQIFEIAARHKYRPNALVRGMQTGKTGTAGVMIPLINSFYSQIVDGIHEEFVENNTIMLLSWNNRTLNKREETLERKIIHQMVDRRVEGIILRPSCEEFERSYFEEIWERNIPLILVDRDMNNIEADFIGTDDVAGGQAAAKYLISLGHRKLAFMGGGALPITSKNREAGFRKILSETPNAYCSESILGKMPTTQETLLALLKSDNRPTALFCYNDEIAFDAVRIILEAGYSVPGDISILGFGNLSTTDSPIPLSTFEQYPVEIGKTAAQVYLDKTTGKANQHVVKKLIKPDLIIRGSTAQIS